jgi:hypothetical protein
MSLEGFKSRFNNLKSRITTNAKVNYQAYRDRKQEERKEAAAFKQRERERYRDSEQKERLKIAAQKGRERARSGGILGAIKGFGGNSKTKKPNMFGGPFGASSGVTRNIITGETIGAPRVHHKKKAHKAATKSRGKSIIIRL